MGKSSINGGFPIVIFDCWRLRYLSEVPEVIQKSSKSMWGFAIGTFDYQRVMAYNDGI